MRMRKGEEEGFMMATLWYSYQKMRRIIGE
jgi:hypothetical protein